MDWFLLATVQVGGACVYVYKESKCTMHTARITLLLGSTWTVSSSAFLSPTLHIPWVLYGVRQRCNEGGYRLEQHSHLETNWQAFVKLIKYPITGKPQSLFDEFQTRKTATLYRCRARISLLWQHCGSWGQKIAHYLPINVQSWAFIHSNWQNMVPRASEREAPTKLFWDDSYQTDTRKQAQGRLTTRW